MIQAEAIECRSETDLMTYCGVKRRGAERAERVSNLARQGLIQRLLMLKDAYSGTFARSSIESVAVKPGEAAKTTPVSAVKRGPGPRMDKVIVDQEPSSVIALTWRQGAALPPCAASRGFIQRDPSDIIPHGRKPSAHRGSPVGCANGDGLDADLGHRHKAQGP
ncbi:hypothetical protein FALBO_280 [Fusarium albosuccineum]|uniref:Uncharacterized protein n=1 Tax=Fusarium albosuccineum TaxID=1237068 RepID=A0A8H4LNY4_9HYPO|nr:hypothetical protein FALBO_280 [Fusarium albosuccineum]